MLTRRGSQPVMTACNRCHRRKTRCDRCRPQCGSCSKSGSQCFYPQESDHQQALDRVRALENKMRRLERENQQLRSSMAPQSPVQRQNQSQQTFEAIDPSITGAQHDFGPHQHNHQDHVTPSETNDQSPLASSTGLDRGRVHSQAIPASQTRYLGTSAGTEFVDLVERVVDLPNPHGDLFARVSDAYCKPGVPALVSSSFPTIPDRATATQLISNYFGHWHITFPLLYRPSFLKVADQIYGDLEFYQNNPHCAFVFDIVLALGSATSKRFEWSFKDTETHYMRAMTHFDEILGYRDIRSLQALLLCCQYGIHATLRDTADEMWDLLGKAGRICVQLGLHQLRSTTHPVKCGIHLTGAIPENLEIEMQIRCFWCFYGLDRIVSINLDRPLTPSDDDIETPLPSTMDDTMLESLNVASTSVLPCSQPAISSFLQFIHIRRIYSKIHCSFYTNVLTRGLPLYERQRVRQDLMNQLADWRCAIPKLQLSSDAEEPTILSSFSYSSWYEALYHTAVLLMYRPSKAFPHEGFQVLTGQEDVLQKTWDSSRALIKRYKEVLQARRLNYSWICLYTIFMAGLANVYSVGRSAQRRKQDPRGFLPDCVDVMADVQDCSNILTAICERWDDARSSCEIFSRLSTSAFRELLKVQGVTSGMSDSQLGQPTGQQNVSSLGNNGHEVLISSNDMLNMDFTNQQANFPLPSPPPTTAQSQELNNTLDFQLFFQDMQNSVYAGDFDGPNEVVVGLDRDWFE